MEKRLNKIIDAIYDSIPVITRLMGIGFVVLCLVGAIMAFNDYHLSQPVHHVWIDNVWAQGLWLAMWLFTRAPLWYTVSFLTTGFLLLFPRLLA